VLVSPSSHSTPTDSSVEWAYAFDVHTNAFFPLYLTLYLAQLFLLPIVFKDNWVCILVGNTLYLAGQVLQSNAADFVMILIDTQVCPVYLWSLSRTEWYASPIFSVSPPTYAHAALPFLIRSEILLAPLLPLFASYVVSLLGFHVAKHVLKAYFGS
jgi:hypothetical protein